MADMVEANQALEERLDKQGNRLYNLENLDIPHKVSKAVDEIVTDVVDWALQAPLRDRFRDLPEADMKEILHHRMWESNSYQAHEDHKMLMKKEEKETLFTENTTWFSTSSTTSSSTTSRYQSTSTTAPSSSKTAASAEYTDWMTTDSRLKLSVSSIPEDLYMDDASAPDEHAQLSDDEDIGHDHIPTVNLRQNWWKPLTEDRPATPEPTWSIPLSDLPVPVNNWASALASTYAPPPENSLLAQTGDMAIFMDWFCKKQGITELKQQDLEGPAYEIVKVFHPNVIHLQYQMEECHKLLTDQVDESIIKYNYLRYGRKSGRPSLSISKMKAAYYPDVGLEQMVLDQMWIEEECKYNIAAMYGHLNHLPPKDKKILSTAVNLWTRNLVIRQWIDEALDYQVKEFKVNRMNSGLNIRFWTKKDVDRSKEFMFAIQKRLKTRRIFRNLESFVGGRIREGDYRLLQRTK
ncbi:hypothetical protein Tco_0004943 [Tanacetum coccineum]